MGVVFMLQTSCHAPKRTHNHACTSLQWHDATLCCGHTAATSNNLLQVSVASVSDHSSPLQFVTSTGATRISLTGICSGMQSVVKMTGHKGQVPWQETLTYNRGPNWKVRHFQLIVQLMCLTLLPLLLPLCATW